MILEKEIAIKAWAEDDRPREKLARFGRQSVSDAELLAILIGSGGAGNSALAIGKRILNATGNSLATLAKYSVPELMKFSGIGEAKAVALVAALELGRRRKENSLGDVMTIRSSIDIKQLMSPLLSDLQHEEFWIIVLNRANRVAHTQKISMGGVSGTLVDPKLVFKTVLEHGCTSVILCHNHPSGNCKPSESDIRLTRRLKSGGELMDIKILDHFIYTDGDYYSFVDDGTL